MNFCYDSKDKSTNLIKIFEEILIQYHDGAEILSQRLSNIVFSIEEKNILIKKVRFLQHFIKFNNKINF